MNEAKDLPYYSGVPVAISPAGWIAIVASVIIAFAQLMLLPFSTTPLNFIPAILFTGIPVLTLMAVTGWQPPALFKRVTLGTVGAGIGFGILTIIVSFAVGSVIFQTGMTSPNPAFGKLANISTIDLALFFLRTFIQLIGEELVSILPLLAVLWLCVQKFSLSRRVGIVIGVIVSTLWFSAMHLPTYNWNVLQCVGIIGSARVVLTLAYLLTRNIWVSSIAHILNDWTLFIVGMSVSHAPIGVEA